METFNKKLAEAVAADVMIALEAVAKKHGLDLVSLGGKFTDATFKPAVEFSIASVAMDRARNDAKLVGADSSWIGRSFKDVSSNIMLTVVGINTARPKNCMELAGSDGKKYKSGVDFVRRFLG